ncbi:hypothetical protein CEXT_240591 [Caerostris extrusa]|uniref:Uncharacterized protein n=1 Tax=Caerostris extrusa TaxID=172846 RepID=A0AAV4QJF1_CAEEX|nr:hypothetical protein CEXT_240591 [Caerostris extrusa]
MAEERKVSVTSASKQAVGVGNADYAAIFRFTSGEGDFSSGRLEDREMDVIRFGRWDYQSECGIGERPSPRFALEGLGTQKDKTSQRVEEYKSLPETLILQSTLFIIAEERRVCLSPQHPSRQLALEMLIIQRFHFCFRCINMDETVGWRVRLA